MKRCARRDTANAFAIREPAGEKTDPQKARAA
jgi:hypothetical protein